jgi:hypothetical protein
MVPHRYRLHDGTLGTEWEALQESLRIQEAHLHQLEERIEILKIQMATADGRPE